MTDQRLLTKCSGIEKNQMPNFENESLLQQAIASLLSKMPNISGVQILQGAQEYGKDIIFKSTGSLGESIICACVVKNKPFSGKAGTNTSIRIIIEQIDQAFDTPMLDENSEERIIHKVYVVNPYPITPAAMSAVKGKLTQRIGQITFLTGSDLYDLFQQYWPDFFAAESSILAQYKHSLEEASGSISSLITLAFDHQISAKEGVEKNIYVPPCFSRVINLYRLPDGIEEVLPVGKIQSPWLVSDLEYLKKDIDQLLHLLLHLCEWPFPNTIFKPNAAKLKEIYSEILSQAENTFLNAFCKRTGRSKISKSQISPKVEIDLLPADKDALIALANRAERYVTGFLAEIRGCLAHVNSEVCKFPQQSDELLMNEKFINYCGIDDCLLASQSPIVKVISRKIFNFGKGIHQRMPCSVLIVGGPGTGKTSFCTRNALKDAELCYENKNNSSPVYVPLHTLSSSNSTTFEEMFLSSAGKSALLPQAVDSGNIRIYLDGLDEIADSNLLTKILKTAQSQQKDGMHRQVIITARDYLYDPHLAWLPRISLRGLEDDEIRLLAYQWLDNDNDATNDFMDQLKRVPGIKRLTRVPLLATVTVLVYKRTKRLPENKARLYNVFVNLLCGGWDLAKGIVLPSDFTMQSKIHVLSALASEMHNYRQREFDFNQFAGVGQRVLSRLKKENMENLLSEILRDGLITRTADRYYFTHLTFQEFLTAKEIHGDPQGSMMDKLWRKYCDRDDWWREVLFFSIGLSDNPLRIAKWLECRVISANPKRAKEIIKVFGETFPDFNLEIFN